MPCHGSQGCKCIADKFGDHVIRCASDNNQKVQHDLGIAQVIKEEANRCGVFSRVT